MNAVVTYIFGENNEILREPLAIDSDTEYICVTDQCNLHSSNWRIVFDPVEQAKCTRDKMPYVKYNPFKYTNAEHIIVMDGTLQITGSLNELFKQLHEVPLLIKRHPERTNLIDELNAWVEMRNAPTVLIEKFKAMALYDHIDLEQNFLIESCILGYRNTPSIKELCNKVLAYMHFLGENGSFCMTNQCPLTYLLLQSKIDYKWIEQKTFATRYRHCSWIKNNR